MKGSFRTGFGTIADKEVVIVVLHTEDGLVGYGESSTLQAPIYTAETVDTCLQVQEHFIVPAILSKDFDTVESFVAAYSSVVGNNIAKAGVECAFWHLLAQRENASLQELVGGTKSEVSVGEGVGIKTSVDETLNDIAQLLGQHFARIKLKIKPGWDIPLLEAVRERWPRIDLTVDGNSSYDLTKHEATLRKLDEFNLSMIEQPLRGTDLVGHAKLQTKLQTPICLDESITSLDDARTAQALGSCQIINIKPGRVGGLLSSMQIHDFAKGHGIGVWCGGMLETGIGRAFNLALASKENFQYPSDMSPYQMYFHEDITTPGLEVKDNGCIDVSRKPGLGFEVHTQTLERYTKKKINLTSVRK